MTECIIKDEGGYYQITDFDFEAEDFHDIFLQIEAAIKEKKQDALLSLASVGVLYSSHLAIFVRIHQMMHRNGLRFVISDISPEIKNLLQITQLDSIFSIYETANDFKNTLKTDEHQHPTKLNFEWQVVKSSEDTVNVICKGNMFAGDQLEELQKSILDFYNVIFDFSNLQSMDSASIALLDRISDKQAVSITGAKHELAEEFRQKLASGKIKLL